MVEVTNELIYKLMLEIQVGQEATTHKIGAIAETLVGLKRDIFTLDARMDSLEVSVHRIGKDIATITIAVDEHTRRLERIEKKLDLTHA
jgi:hypothetical protein